MHMSNAVMTCPKCGRMGSVRGQEIVGNARMVLHLGLEPDECDGCRETLENAGFAITEIPAEVARVMLSDH